MDKRSKIQKNDPTNSAGLNASAQAVKQYFEDAKEFIAGTRTDLPDETAIVKTGHPESSLVNPEPGSDVTGPFVASFIDFRERPGKPAPTKPYLFDPWWFAIMRWLELSGRRFRINTVTPKGSNHPFYFVTCTLREFGLRRLIMDTPKGKATPDRGDYHDYRRVALRTMSDAALIAATDYDMNTTYRNREEFLTLLANDFKQRLPRKRMLPNVAVGRQEHLERLSEWFGLAEGLFARRYSGTAPIAASSAAK